MKNHRFKNAAAFIFGLLVAIILLEVLLRLFNPIEMRVRGERLVLPVNAVYEFKDVNISGLDRHVIHTKNSLGFRGPEPGGEYESRIIAIGGSTTEGFYLSDGRDWPAVMGDKLKDLGYSVWVNNAGMDGHSTYGHIVLMEDFLLPLQPDYVIIMAGLNDIGRGTVSERRVRSGLSFESVGSFVRSLSDYSEIAATGLHLYRVYIAGGAGVRHRFLDIAELPETQIDYEQVEIALTWHAFHFTEPYRKRLEQLVISSKSAGITPVLVTQAILPGDATDPVTDVDLARMDFMGGSSYQLWRVMELYNDVTRDVASSHEVPLIDLAQKMDKSSEYYYDMFHFTNKGSDRAGQLIAEFMAEILNRGGSLRSR